MELTNERDKEFKRAEELTASLAEEIRKHERELTDWTKKLTDCESAKTLAVECKLKVKLERRQLQEQLGKAAMRSEESRRRMEKLEAAYRHLRDETTDELRLRVEKRLRRFAMPTLRITDCNRG